MLSSCIRILSSVGDSVQWLNKMRLKVISSDFFWSFSCWTVERTKQVKSTEAAAAAHYSLRLGFLKRNLWPRTHISSVYLYTNLPLEYVISFKTRWMVRVNNCTISPLSGKGLYLLFLIHIDPSSFWSVGQNGSFWSTAIWHSLIPHYSYGFHCAPRKNPKSVILFLFYNCLPDTFWIITSSGTHLISVGRRGAGCVVLWKSIFIWKEERKKTFGWEWENILTPVYLHLSLTCYKREDIW